MSIQSIVVFVLEGLLGLLSAFTAYTLFAWTPESVTKAREALHYPRWYWVLAGIAATIGAIGLFVGLGIPVVGAVAALWMIAYFVVAALTHLLRKDMAGMVMPLPFLAVCMGLAALRWGDMAPLHAFVLGLIGR